MSVIGYACDHAKHRECGQRLGAVSMLNGSTAVLVCDCSCHAPARALGGEPTHQSTEPEEKR